MSCFKNALIFGDQNFSSGDHFTKESRQKATSEKLELEALKMNYNTGLSEENQGIITLSTGNESDKNAC